MEQIHATAIDIGGDGVLLRGPSGCGKSDLALRLIDAGARLVADDRIAGLEDHHRGSRRVGGDVPDGGDETDQRLAVAQILFRIDLDLGAAAATPHRLPDRVGRQSVDLHRRHAGLQRGIDVVECVDLHFDRQLGIHRAHPPHRFGDAPGHAHVVNPDEHAVVEPNPMVHPARHPHGILFQGAQGRHGLPGVEHGDPSRAGIDEIPCHRGNPAQPLQEVQRGALRRQQRGRTAPQPGQLGTGLAALSLASRGFELHMRVELPETLHRHVQTGQHTRCADDDHAGRRELGGDDRLGGHIAPSHVLGKRPPHDLAIGRRVE